MKGITSSLQGREGGRWREGEGINGGRMGGRGGKEQERRDEEGGK